MGHYTASAHNAPLTGEIVTLYGLAPTISLKYFRDWIFIKSDPPQLSPINNHVI